MAMMQRCVRMILCSSIAAIPAAYDAGSARADTGDHWCRQGFDFNSATSIPFYIHPGLAQTLLRADGTPWTQLELEAEVKYAIERLMDQAPSGLPPIYFAGYETTTTIWDSNPGAGKIALRPNYSSGSECNSHQSGDYSRGVRLYLATSNWPGCNVRWEHWNDPPSSNTVKVLGGTFLHELMHGLGYHHTPTCNTVLPTCSDNPDEEQYCSLMSAVGQSPEAFELEYGDWDALTTVYGDWEADTALRRQSSDALTWTSLSGSGLASGPNWAASRAMGGSTKIPVLRTDASTMVPRLYLWDAATNIFTSWGSSVFAPNFGQMATSVGGGFYYAFFMSAVSQNASLKHPQFSYFDAANNFVTRTTTQYASRQGVGGAWDNKTGRLVQVWRNKNNQIVMATSPTTGPIGTGSVPAALSGDGNKASHTPSIACGPAGLAYNCLMVWVTAAAQPSDRLHNLRWVQFYVSGSSIVFDSTIYQNGYVMYGPPQVVYRGPTDSAQAFVVGFKNPGRCFYSLSKGTATTSTFGNERSHCGATNAHFGPPMVGSTAAGVAEVWAQGNVRD